MSEEIPISVTYKSWCHPTQGWDAMQVVRNKGDHVLDSVIIARDGAGTIVRKTDVLLDVWEIVEDPTYLQAFQSYFDERDRAIAKHNPTLRELRYPNP
jgi:hypothetical protein